MPKQHGETMIHINKLTVVVEIKHKYSSKTAQGFILRVSTHTRARAHARTHIHA